MLHSRQVSKFSGIVIAVAILLAGASVAQAATWYLQASGKNWNSNYNGAWGGNGPPAAGDTVYIGDNYSVTVSGPDVANYVYVGTSSPTSYPGTGTITISATGLTVGGGMYLGSSTNTGTVNQGAGLTTLANLTFGGATSGWVGGTYNLTGGTLAVGSGGIVVGTYGAANFNMGGGTVQANASFNPSVNVGLTGSATTSTINSNGYNLSFSGNISDSGGGNGLTKAGAGTLTLSGANTYTGATTVAGGTLILNYAANSTVLNSNVLTLQSGGTVQLLANSSVATTQNVGTLNVGAGGGTVILNPNGGPGVTLNINTSLSATTIGGALLLNVPSSAAVTTSLVGFSNGIYGGRIVYYDGNDYNWASTTAPFGQVTLSAYAGYSSMAASGADTEQLADHRQRVAYRQSDDQHLEDRPYCGQHPGFGRQYLDPQRRRPAGHRWRQ